MAPAPACRIDATRTHEPSLKQGRANPNKTPHVSQAKAKAKPARNNQSPCVCVLCVTREEEEGKEGAPERSQPKQQAASSLHTRRPSSCPLRLSPSVVRSGEPTARACNPHHSRSSHINPPLLCGRWWPRPNVQVDTKQCRSGSTRATPSRRWATTTTTSPLT